MKYAKTSILYEKYTKIKYIREKISLKKLSIPNWIHVCDVQLSKNTFYNDV